MFRPSRDFYYLCMAKIASMRATCSRAKMGCVLVDWETKRVVSIGYNGSPPGTPHCVDVGCLLIDKPDHGESCIRTIHAETQAISFIRGKFDNLIAYITSAPCINCYKQLVSAGVKRIIYMNEYVDHDRDKLEKVYGVPIYPATVNMGEEEEERLTELWKKIDNTFEV